MPPPPSLRPRGTFATAWPARLGRTVGTCVAACVLLGVGVTGCRRGRQHTSQVPSLAVAYDLRPIDARTLEDDAGAMRRALGMPAGEVAARLERFVAAQDVQLTLAQAGRTLLQERTQASVAFDGGGGVRAVQRGSRHGFEVVAVGEKAFVRLDRGHFRGKGRRDVEVPEMTEVAYSGLRQVVQLFGPLRLASAKNGRVGGREAVGYVVRLGDERTPEARAKGRGAGDGPTVLFPPGALPAVPPGAWRDNVQAATLEGRLDVDALTGVVLQARLKGELTVDGPEGRPMQVQLALRHDVTEVGRAAAIAEPAGAVGEFRRPMRPREPLAFFRDQLPQTPAQAPGTSGNAPR